MDNKNKKKILSAIKSKNTMNYNIVKAVKIKLYT